MILIILMWLLPVVITCLSFLLIAGSTQQGNYIVMDNKTYSKTWIMFVDVLCSIVFIIVIYHHGLW